MEQPQQKVMYNRKIKNYLLMPKIQLRYTYYLIALVVAPQAVFLLFMIVKMRKLGIEFEARNVPADLFIYLEETMRSLGVFYSASIFFIIFFILYGTIMISHRFVGPMYVIKNYLLALKNGEPLHERELRKEDEMQEIFQLLKEIAKNYKK